MCKHENTGIYLFVYMKLVYRYSPVYIHLYIFARIYSSVRFIDRMENPRLANPVWPAPDTGDHLCLTVAYSESFVLVYLHIKSDDIKLWQRNDQTKCMSVRGNIVRNTCDAATDIFKWPYYTGNISSLNHRNLPSCFDSRSAW